MHEPAQCVSLVTEIHVKMFRRIFHSRFNPKLQSNVRDFLVAHHTPSKQFKPLNEINSVTFEVYQGMYCIIIVFFFLNGTYLRPDSEMGIGITRSDIEKMSRYTTARGLEEVGGQLLELLWRSCKNSVTVRKLLTWVRGY